MGYADRFREELTYFRTELPILTGEKTAERCHTLSLLLTAAVRSGEITTTEIYEKRRQMAPDRASHDVQI